MYMNTWRCSFRDTKITRGYREVNIY
uniref:Uncharacterized protein n=1 Tax=Arundo donax TaxID=35708 RepID=A0A0A9BV93_ARUDO